MKTFADRRHLFFMFLLVLFVIVLMVVFRTVTERAQSTYGGLTEQAEYPANPYDPQDFFRDEYGFLNYDDGKIRALRGIDVSTHQDKIDWKKVRKAGVQFAMVRVGYSSYDSGVICEDDFARVNLAGARDAGISTGIYFFSQATTVEEAIAEANFAVSFAKKYDPILPIAFDMEDVEEGRTGDLSIEQKTEIADAFCTVVENHGFHSLIYANPEWAGNAINLNYLSSRKLWLAHYVEETGFAGAFQMWQYSAEGSVDGIAGNVDLDVYFVKKSGGTGTADKRLLKLFGIG